MLASGVSSVEHESKRKALLIGSLLAVLVLALYWPVQSFDFVNLDDDVYVTHNRQVQGGLSPEGIVWSFSNVEAGFWQPLIWLSHMFDCQLYGLNAGGHHWTNVLIHLASTLLLFIVMSAMTRALYGSAFVAALFAIHPLHVESVAWVSERKDVLSGFFWILTMGAYVQYVRHPNFRRYLLVLGSFLLGLLSKPTLVTLPFALLLLDYWPLRRFEKARTCFDRLWADAPAYARMPGMTLVFEKGPLIALSVIAGALAWIAEEHVGAVQNTISYPVDVRLANAVLSYVLYITKTIWPADLAAFYPHLGMPPLWQSLASAALLIAVTGIVLRFRRQAPFMLVGWFWYLGTLFPVIGLVQIGSHALADRYTYIPLVGLFIALVWGMKELAIKRPDSKINITVLSLVTITALLLAARAQVATWENSLTLFERALAVTERNPLAHNNIGAFYLERNECQKAVPYFLKAIEMRKDYAYPYGNLGVCAARRNDTEQALDFFRQAILLNPRFTKAMIDRGLYLTQLGRLEEATESFQEVLRINPDYESAHVNLSSIFNRKNRLAEAEWHLNEALRINRGSAEAHNNLGILRTAQGRIEDAIACFLKARELAPGNAVIEENLRIAYEKQQMNRLAKETL